MCLSLIGEVSELLADGEAVVEADGRPRRVSLAPLVFGGEPAAVGDWVLVHTGMAVERLDEAVARDLLAEQRAITGPSIPNGRTEP